MLNPTRSCVCVYVYIYIDVNTYVYVYIYNPFWRIDDMYGHATQVSTVTHIMIMDGNNTIVGCGVKLLDIIRSGNPS